MTTSGKGPQRQLRVVVVGAELDFQPTPEVPRFAGPLVLRRVVPLPLAGPLDRGRAGATRVQTREPPGASEAVRRDH